MTIEFPSLDYRAILKYLNLIPILSILITTALSATGLRNSLLMKLLGNMSIIILARLTGQASVVHE